MFESEILCGLAFFEIQNFGLLGFELGDELPDLDHLRSRGLKGLLPSFFPHNLVIPNGQTLDRLSDPLLIDHRTFTTSRLH